MLLKITPHTDAITLFAARSLETDFLPLLDGGVADLSSSSTPTHLANT